MSNEINDTIILAISKIEVSLTNRKTLKADIYDVDGKSLFPKSLSMKELNMILDAIYAKGTVEDLFELIYSGKVLIDDAVHNEYSYNNKHFEKRKTLTIERVTSIDVESVERILVDVTSDGDVIGEISFKNKDALKIKDINTLNALLDLMYEKTSLSIFDLISLRKLNITPEFFGSYILADENKHFSKNVHVEEKGDKPEKPTLEDNKIVNLFIWINDDGKIEYMSRRLNGEEFGKAGITNVNYALEDMSDERHMTVKEMIEAGLVTIDSSVYKEFEVNDMGLTIRVLDTIDKDNVSTISYYTVDCISDITVNTNSDGEIEALVRYADDSRTSKINDIDTLNQVLSIMLDIYSDGTLSYLKEMGRLVISSDNFYDYYEEKDNRFVKKEKINVTKVEVLAGDESLVGRVLYSDGHIDYLHDINEVNNFIEKLSNSLSMNLPALIAAGLVVPSKMALDRYEVVGDKTFGPKVKEPPVRTIEHGPLDTGGDDPKEDEDDSKKGKLRVKLREFYRRPIAWISTVVFIGGIGYAVARLLNNHSNNINNNTTRQAEPATEDEDKYALTNSEGETVTVEIDNGDYHSSFEITDEEIYYDGKNVYYGGIPAREDLSGYTGGEATEDYGYSTSGRYADLGSSVDSDDMGSQLDTIDGSVMKRVPFQYENLVVADDYDAIRAVSNVRNKILSGELTHQQGMDMLAKYFFEENRYVDGSIIEPYITLSPYAQYIVVRVSQGVLQWDINYKGNGDYMLFDFDTISPSYDIESSSLHEELMGRQK